MNHNELTTRVGEKPSVLPINFDKKAKCVSSVRLELEKSENCANDVCRPLQDRNCSHPPMHTRVLVGSQPAQILSMRRGQGHPVGYGDGREPVLAEGSPVEHIYLRAIELEPPWIEIGNLLARRYQIAGWSRTLFMSDFSLLRAVCGDRHPREIFLQDLEDKVLKGQTQGTREYYAARIKSIWNSMRMLGIIPLEMHPEMGLPKIKVTRAAPRPISKEQAIMLITQATHPLNEWFMFACLAGMRAIEVTRVQGSWLEHHGDGYMLRIHGKGDTDLVIPCHPKLVELIQSKNTLGRLYPVKPNYLSRLACSEMRRLGIPIGKQDNSRLSFHSCRHFFATEMLISSGGNLVTTSRLMRHQSPIVTMRYAGLINNEERIAVGKLFEGLDWTQTA